jgi:aminoglycoside phosphotransferase (APT) family kinase protein
MEAGRLIASGRDADIFEFGPDLVLRRARARRSLEYEARAMELAFTQGFPVPRVHDVRADGTELVLDRIRGPGMADAILKHPWTLPGAATTLADLHDQLHEITGPDWMVEMPDGGDRLLHLDLHPLNIILDADRGPVVIDWANAARGAALTDVAATYVLLTCPDMPGPAALRAVAQPMRMWIARRFSARYRGRALDIAIADAAELKTLDGNMSGSEVATMRRLSEKKRRKAVG